MRKRFFSVWRRDRYTLDAQRTGVRSRAAFKLEEIAQKYRILKKRDKFVDLGAAPGGFSVVGAKLVGARGESEVLDLREKGEFGIVEKKGVLSDLASLELERAFEGEEMKDVDDGNSKPASKTGKYQVVAVDLLPFDPIPGVLRIYGDFMSKHVQDTIKSRLRRGKADVVLCDVAHSFIGDGQTDFLHQMDLSKKAWNFVIESNILKNNGHFLVKVRHGGTEDIEFRHLLQQHFAQVQIVKPPASRKASAEYFLMCLGRKT